MHLHELKMIYGTRQHDLHYIAPTRVEDEDELHYDAPTRNEEDYMDMAA